MSLVRPGIRFRHQIHAWWQEWHVPKNGQVIHGCHMGRGVLCRLPRRIDWMIETMQPQEMVIFVSSTEIQHPRNTRDLSRLGKPY